MTDIKIDWSKYDLSNFACPDEVRGLMGHAYMEGFIEGKKEQARMNKNRDESEKPLKTCERNKEG